MSEHVVQPGECISSIAYHHGIPIEALSEANPDLEAERGEFGILAEGDVVVLPERVPKNVQLGSTGSHRIRLHRTANPVTLRFTRVSGAPQPAQRVVLTVDGVAAVQERTTDDDGRVTFMIPARALKGTIVLGDPGVSMPVVFGELDPISTTRGVQSRLKHLGYYSRDVDGKLGPYTYQAVRAFQKENGLSVTSELDPPTRDLLVLRAGT